MEPMDSVVQQEFKILSMNDQNKKNRVLFVCMGNICRSPAAEAILKQMGHQNLAIQLHVESCGIGDWHVGQGFDKRMQNAALERGVVLSGQAKQLEENYFDQFDYILAADNEVMKYLYHYADTPERKAKVFLMTAFSSIYKGQEVPDPYYQGSAGFEIVLDMLEDSCRGLIEQIKLNKKLT